MGNLIFVTKILESERPSPECKHRVGVSIITFGLLAQQLQDRGVGEGASD